MAPTKGYRFGFISTLHTFGRALNFVPHLHVLVAEGVYDKNNNFKKVSCFNTRYAGHPPVSESRIINVDFEFDWITYYYDPHEDDNELEPYKLKGRQCVTENIYVFITILSVQISILIKINTSLNYPLNEIYLK